MEDREVKVHQSKVFTYLDS